MNDQLGDGLPHFGTLDERPVAQHGLRLVLAYLVAHTIMLVYLPTVLALAFDVPPVEMIELMVENPRDVLRFYHPQLILTTQGSFDFVVMFLSYAVGGAVFYRREIAHRSRSFC